jgi:hypothetical protein
MTASTYLEWEDQATGANNNTWGDTADDNFGIFETAIARFLSIATTGGTTVLTSSQNRYPIIRVTGILVSNATIQVRTAEKNWTFINATTGAYTVTVKTSAGTGKTIPRGLAVRLYCDGTNVEHARYAMLPKAIAGGTADALTATFEPPTVAADIQDGYTWIVEAANANATTTPTFNPDGTGALTIKKTGAQALLAGDIYGAGHKLILTYDASGGHVELLNPAKVAVAQISGALGQQTLNLLAQGMVARTTNGATSYTAEKATNDVMVAGYEFSASTEQAIQIAIPMPKGWDEGTLVAKFYWTTSGTAGTGNVIWGIRARAVSNDDAIDGSWGTAQEVTDGFLADGDLHVTAETSALTVGGSPAAEDMVWFEVYRKAADGSDTYTQTAVLQAVMVHYTTAALTDD